MDDTHTYVIEVDGDPEEAIERIKTREREFASGWLIERGGSHLNIDHIVKMRAFERRR